MLDLIAELLLRVDFTNLERLRQLVLEYRAGLEAMGMQFIVDEPHRLPQLNAVTIPEGVDDAAVRGRLLDERRRASSRSSTSSPSSARSSSESRSPTVGTSGLIRKPSRAVRSRIASRAFRR